MLFNEIFSENWPSSKEWLDEINNWLEFIKSKNQLDRYLSRLRSESVQRDKSLAEIFSAYIIEKTLNYEIIKWEEVTVNGKNVEFVILDNDEEIYCEVKCPGWQGELSKQDFKNSRSKMQKYISNETRSFLPCQEIKRTIKKAYDKFLPNKKNVLIINDDLFVSPTEMDFKIALRPCEIKS